MQLRQPGVLERRLHRDAPPRVKLRAEQGGPPQGRRCCCRLGSQLEGAPAPHSTPPCRAFGVSQRAPGLSLGPPDPPSAPPEPNTQTPRGQASLQGGWRTCSMRSSKSTASALAPGNMRRKSGFCGAARVLTRVEMGVGAMGRMGGNGCWMPVSNWWAQSSAQAAKVTWPRGPGLALPCLPHPALLVPLQTARQPAAAGPA